MDRLHRLDHVSVLYREPKLLKAKYRFDPLPSHHHVSVLYREPKLLKVREMTESQLIAELFQCSTVSRNC